LKPFNGQLRLKNGYSGFLTKLKQFSEKAGPYSELTIDDYLHGSAQKRHKEFFAQLELLKAASAELNQEAGKYIILNNLKDFRKTSAVPEKWNKAIAALTYCQKLQEAVLTIGAMERDFYRLIEKDSLEKAEGVRLFVLQLSAYMGAIAKSRMPVPIDVSLREAAVNSINLYRMDAFRNFKTMIALRRKEMEFHKKYPNGANGLGKNEALKSKFEKEKSQLDGELSNIRSLAKELKKDRDRHENAFDANLNRYVEKWGMGA
jgi:hypothetical protein